VLWAWRSKPFTEAERDVLARAVQLLAQGAPLAERLAELITEEEIGALRARAQALESAGSFPEPSDDWPPLPWPLV